MKKLMIAAAAAMLGIVANAATMNWATCGAVQDPTGAYCGGEEYVTMYMFVIDSTAYDKLTEGGAAGVSAAVWATYGGDNLASATDKYVDDGMGQFTISDPNSYSAGDKAYAAIIMAYDTGDGITHYKGNVGMWEFPSPNDKTIQDMDIKIFGETGSTALEWSSVPEPTSGLLLLLGVAGLALRRRRA